MFASLHTSTMTVRRVESRGTFAQSAANLLKGLRLALTAYEQRRVLSRMDAFMLADIGLTADEAAIEAARPFWDVPATWRNAC